MIILRGHLPDLERESFRIFFPLVTPLTIFYIFRQIAALTYQSGANFSGFDKSSPSPLSGPSPAGSILRETSSWYTVSTNVMRIFLEGSYRSENSTQIRARELSSLMAMLGLLEGRSVLSNGWKRATATWLRSNVESLH